MALNKFMQSVGSAFDRLGNQNDSLAQIEENTRQTAEATAIGGDLYSRIDELTTAITDITEGKGGSGAGDFKQALALAIVAPSMKPIGLGLKYVVDALNALPDGKEAGEKMEALTGGLTRLGDVGASILKFAGYMLLATPILILTAAAAPIIGLGLFLLVGAVMLATKPLEDEEKLKAIERLQGVGLGILALGASLALFFVIQPFALKGLLGAALMIAGISAVLYFIPEKALDKMQKFSDSILNFALGIGATAAVFAIIGFIAKPVFDGALVAMGIIAAIGLSFFLLDRLGIMDKIEEGGKGLLYAAGAILGLAVALALFKVIAPPMDQLLNIALVVGVVGLTFGLIGKFGDNIRKGAVAMAFAGLSIIVLALSLKVLSMVVGSITGEEAVKSLGALLLIGLIGAAFYLAGTQAAFIALGAGSMILVGVAVIVLAAGIAIMGKAIGDKGWEFIGQVMAIVGGLGVAMGVAGLAAPFIAAGAGALILAGAALVTIGAGLVILGKVDFKKGPLAFSGQKTEPIKILGVTVSSGGRPKTNMEVALEAVANSFMLNPIKIGAMYAGAPALILAGAALITIATGIKKFQNISEQADLKSLGENVNMIVFALSDTFGKIGKMYPGGRQSLFSSIFGGGGGSPVAQGISSVMGMGSALTSIAKGVQAMANLQFPTGFDKDGNATGYEPINLTDAVPKLIANTKLIVTGLSSAFAEVGESEAAQGSSWFTSSSYEKGIKVVKKMGKPLYELANGVQNMANLKFPVAFDKDGNATGYKSIGNVDGLVKKIAKNTKALITGLAGVFEEVGKSEAADTSWFSKNNFEKGASLIMDLADPYKSLTETVDDVVSITGKIKDAEEVKTKIKAIISSVTDFGGDDAGLIGGKAYLIRVLGNTYEKLGIAIPSIVQAISQFTVDKAKAFAAVFGGESPAELFESKTNYLKGLTMSYMRMAVAIPLIVGSINTVSAEQLDAFTSIYGGEIPVEADALKNRENLFIAVGNSYEKIGTAAQQITSSVNSSDPMKLSLFKGMFMGRVSKLRPIAGYEAQTELWNAIGTNMTATATAFPQIAGAVNSMELEKLTEARHMFEALAVLAEGGEDPEDILEAMGESLETALQNLADMLESFRTTVAEQGEAQQGVLGQIAAMPGQLVGGIIDGVTGRGGSGADSAEVVRAVKQLQTAMTNQGIKIKNINDLV